MNEPEVMEGEVVGPGGEVMVAPKAMPPAEIPPGDLGAGALAFHGAGDLQLTKAEKDGLMEEFKPDEHDVLPTGEVYIPQVHYRRRLNKVLGPGDWAMVPQGLPKMQGNTVIQQWHMVIRNRFAASAWGEQDYRPSNDRMSEATAAESAKSNSLVRCCKDLGMGSECWDKQYTQKFKQSLCVCVEVKQRDGSYKWQWRRKDGRKFRDEKPPQQAGA